MSLSDRLSDLTEVRAFIALLLTLSMIVAVFAGHLEAKELELPFATVVGFYFASAQNPKPPNPPTPSE